MAKIKPRKVSTGRGKAIIGGVCSIGMFAVLLGGVYMTYKLDQREVDIVTFKRDVSIGTKITEADIEMGTILKAEYDAKKDTSWVGNDGQSKQGQIYIRYDDAGKILGQYVTNARRLGDAVTARDLSTNEIEPNPWFEEVPIDNELYTMKFDSSDTYTRMLMPGSTIRMRMIFSVPNSQAESVRKEIANQKPSAAFSSEENKDGESTKNMTGFISAVMPFIDTDNRNENDVDVPVAEIVFDNLVILDAMNGSNESVFDLYYSLTNMDSTIREQYIRENAAELRSRLIPQTLILSLDKEQASAIAEFENSAIPAYKWTVVKTEQEDELLQKFMDIATRIYTIHIDPVVSN